MPLLLLVGLTGVGGGFILGKGVDGVSSTIKWVVIGGVAYMIAKQIKAIQGEVKAMVHFGIQELIGSGQLAVMLGVMYRIGILTSAVRHMDDRINLIEGKRS